MFGQLRSNVKTVEFWLSLVSVMVLAIFPDFPKEPFMVLGAWIGSRVIEKSISATDPDKRSWKTSEFYVAIGMAILQFLIPDMDPTVLYSVMGFVGLRSVAKGSAKRIKG